MSVQILHYVPKAKAHEFVEIGWKPRPEILDGTHHGEYSIVMEWTRDDDPIMPRAVDNRSEAGT